GSVQLYEGIRWVIFLSQIANPKQDLSERCVGLKHPEKLVPETGASHRTDKFWPILKIHIPAGSSENYLHDRVLRIELMGAFQRSLCLLWFGQSAVEQNCKVNPKTGALRLQFDRFAQGCLRFRHSLRRLRKKNTEVIPAIGKLCVQFDRFA